MNESAWISELTREIGNRIAVKLELSPEVVHTVGAPSIRRFSITQKYLIEVETNAHPVSLIAKTRRYASKSQFAESINESRTQRLVKREYETHCSASGIFSDHASMSVPELFDLQMDLATIVMETVQGESLAQAMSNLNAIKNLHPKKNLAVQFTRAGAWLRMFHEGIAEHEPVEWRREAVDAFVDRLLNTLRDDGIGQARFDRITGCFDQRLSESDRQSLQTFGVVHGDFKPAHVLLNQQKMVVIDFGTTRSEYGAADAGNFLADLACNAYGPRLVTSTRLKILAKGFLDGYNGPAGINTLVDLYCGVNLLRLWCKRRQRFPNGTPLRKLDTIIDLSRCRRLLNRTYVDNWFERTIFNVLT